MPERLRLEAVEYAMAVRISAAVQRLQGSMAYIESRPSTIGVITLEVKQTGERSAGNLHAAFEVAGTGRMNCTSACVTAHGGGIYCPNLVTLHRLALGGSLLMPVAPLG
jgi:hypothetical protein